MNESPPISNDIALSCALRLPTLRALAEFFDSKGVDAYLFGGTLRDVLLHRNFRDIDIAVRADSTEIGRDLAAALDGDFMALHDKWEVCRVLPGVSGARHIDISTFQGDIEQHMRRRDFTINAMALPLGALLDANTNGSVLDVCGGMRDLENGVVRMTSSDALDADRVRLMRGARIAAELEFSFEAETADAIKERAWRVADVAQERVRDELMRILNLPNVREGIWLLDDLGLLCRVMPELVDAKGITQPKEHYWDVFGHLVEAVGWVETMFFNGSGVDDVFPLSYVPRFEGIDDYFGEEISDGYDRLAFLKLAALLHDVSKPATKTVEASGRIRFLGHHSEGAKVARGMLTRLRFGKRGVEHVVGMVQHHLRPTQMAQKGEMPTNRALYKYYRDAGDVAVDTVYLNMADYLAARGPMLERGDWVSHCGLMRYILEDESSGEGGSRKDALQSLPRLVNGYDIIGEFTLAPGPAVGRMLELVRDAQASGEVSTREQALELVRADLERGGDGA